MRSFHVFIWLALLGSVAVSIFALIAAKKSAVACERWRQAAAAWQRLAMQHGCPVKERDVIKIR